MAFLFSLRQPVVIAVSGERGEVLSRAEHVTGENNYCVRYCDPFGVGAVEGWRVESALRAADPQPVEAPPPQGALFAQRGGDRIPASYLPAALHCTLPRLDAQADAAFALETNGVVHRFRLDAANARVLLETLDPAYWLSMKSAIADHSAGLSESPSAARSTPAAAEF